VGGLTIFVSHLPVIKTKESAIIFAEGKGVSKTYLSQAWQYHRNLPSPFDLILFPIALVLPASARGILSGYERA